MRLSCVVPLVCWLVLVVMWWEYGPGISLLIARADPAAMVFVSILLILLGLLVVTTAFSAERSGHSHHSMMQTAPVGESGLSAVQASSGWMRGHEAAPAVTSLAENTPDAAARPERYRLLCVHTCGGTDHADWVHIHTTTPMPDGTIQHHGHCHGRPLTLIEGPGGDIPSGWTNPCPCWDAPTAVPHPGHCCYSDANCDHHDLVRACDEKLPIGDIPMWRDTSW